MPPLFLEDTMRLLFLLIILASCGQLPIDKSPAPIDYGHLTLEMHYGAQYDLGTLGTSVDFSQPGDTKLKIPVWNKGELSITSKRCAFDKTAKYGKKKKEFYFDLKELLQFAPTSEFACIFNVYLYVEGLDRGMQGQFYVMKKTEGIDDIYFKILGHTYKSVGGYQFAEGYNERLEVNFIADKPGIIFFEGCGAKGEKSFALNPSFTLEELAPEKKSCIITFGIIYDDESRAVAELNLKVFSNTVLQIPDPIMTYDNGTLEITSEEPVGYVGIGSSYRRGLSVTANVGDRLEIVRLVTANGRFKMIGVKKGEVVWRPSVKY